MKFRPQRELLEDSMKEVREFDTVTEFERYIHHEYLPPYYRSRGTQISVTPYPSAEWNFDPRIGWHTYIVELKGWGVVGFTDGPLPS
jgi:hypothetical protein